MYTFTNNTPANADEVNFNIKALGSAMNPLFKFTNSTSLNSTNFVSRGINVMDFSGSYSSFNYTNLIAMPSVNEAVGSSGTYTLETQQYIVPSSTTSAFGAVDYDIFKIYDEFDDTSIDTGLWTVGSTVSGDGTATVTETSDYIDIVAYGDGTGANDTYVSLTGDDDILGSNATYEIKYYIKARGNDTQDSWGRIVAWGGAAGSTIISHGAPSGGASDNSTVFYYGVLKLTVDSINDKIYYRDDYYIDYQFYDGNLKTYKDKLSVEGEVDIAGFSNLYIKFEGYGKGDAGSNEGRLDSYKIYYVREMKNNPSTTVQLQLSANGGTNYSQVWNPGYSNELTSGSDIRLKVTGTIGTDEGIAIKRVMWGTE